MAMLNNQRVYFVVVPYIICHQHYKVYRGWYDLNGNTRIAGVIVAIRIPKQALTKQEVSSTPIAKETTNTFNHQPTYCIDHTPETSTLTVLTLGPETAADIPWHLFPN